MTIRELYQKIGGDYDQVINVLRMEKLVDKHVRRFADNGVVDKVLAAGEDMNPTELFETTHAMKGVCANLGFTELTKAASELTEEFRPGHERMLTDDEVRARLSAIRETYQRVLEGLREYEATN